MKKGGYCMRSYLDAIKKSPWIRSSGVLCAAYVLILIVYHLLIDQYFSDDEWFAGILANSGQSLLEYIAYRYRYWSSRLIIEGITPFFTMHVTLWKGFNISIYLLMAYALYRVSHGVSLLAVIVLLAIYPLESLSSAGLITSHLFYFWPLAFQLYSLVALDKIVNGQPVKTWEAVLSFGAAIVGTNMEQHCMVQFAFLLCYTTMYFVKCRRKSLWILCGHWIIAVFSLAFILMTPGNAARKASEVVTWMPYFYEKTLLDQFINGLESTMSWLLDADRPMFWIFTALLPACLWKKDKNGFHLAVGAMPFALTTLCKAREWIGGPLRSLLNLIAINAGVNAQTWSSLPYYVPIAVYCAAMACVLLSFFWLFDDLTDALICCTLFAASIASRVVMGFSPTLFASAERTFTVCYMLLVLLSLRLLGSLKENLSSKAVQIGRLALVAVGLWGVTGNVLYLIRL